VGLLAHMSFSMSASLILDCSSFRQDERVVVAEWARSLAASTALLRMEGSCTAQASTMSKAVIDMATRPGGRPKHTRSCTLPKHGPSCAERRLRSDQ